MKAIDPSEILVDGKNKSKQSLSGPNIWIRFFARMFDYGLICMAVWAVRHFGRIPLSAGGYEHWFPFELFLWVPIEASLLSTLGVTPGKWLLKETITPKLSFDAALKRSLSVWIRGLGMGMPFVNVFCLLIAYQKFRFLKTTSWDMDARVQVRQEPCSQLRFGIVAVAAMLMLLFYRAS